MRSQNGIQQRTEPGSPKLRKHRIECSSHHYDSKHTLFKEQDSWTGKLCLQENPALKKNLITIEIYQVSYFWLRF